MSTNIIFQIGLYNGVSMLLNNASQIAILQNSQLTNNSKAQQLNQLQLTEILDCCLASRTSFAILIETLGKILHEYNH